MGVELNCCEGYNHSGGKAKNDGWLWRMRQNMRGWGSSSTRDVISGLYSTVQYSTVQYSTVWYVCGCMWTVLSCVLMAVAEGTHRAS